jgi:hypothetical protein
MVRQQLGRYVRKAEAWVGTREGRFGTFYRERIRGTAAYYGLLLGFADPTWTERIQDAQDCPDNAFIPRVPNAGKIQGSMLTMHNGLKVGRDSYYGAPLRLMMERNRGVHEPQEERVFAELLKHVAPGGTMIELGAYWGFYSMWFLKEVENGRAFLVEPEATNLASGRKNFDINGMSGTFVHAYVGKDAETKPDGTRTISVDALVEEFGIEHISILHSDIQGFEVEMLHGAKRTLDAGKVDYAVISTHSNKLHEECLKMLRARQFEILASADLNATYSVDGLIVGRAPSIRIPGPIPISRKKVASAS